MLGELDGSHSLTLHLSTENQAAPASLAERRWLGRFAHAGPSSRCVNIELDPATLLQAILATGALREVRDEHPVAVLGSPIGPRLGRNVMEWFTRTTSIGGTSIPNWVLVLIAVIIIWLIYRFLF
jgi:hypothetical protein